MLLLSAFPALVLCSFINAEPVISKSPIMDKISHTGNTNAFPSSLPHTLTRAPDIRRRQGGQGRVGCGYFWGNGSSPLIMSTDSTCTTAYTVGLWGSCIYSSNIPVCSLYGVCVDQAGCSDGCTPNVNANKNAITQTLSCSVAYCQSYLLTDQSSPSLGTQTSYTCNTASQESPVLVFVSPLDTPVSVLASTTSSSDILATSSINSEAVTSSSTSSPQPSSTSFLSSASSSSLASSSTSTPATPQATMTSSNQQVTHKHTGAIVGSVVGFLAVICICAAIWCLMKYRRTREELPTTESSPPSNDVQDPTNHVHELMEKNAHTPEIGGSMIMAEMESPRVESHEIKSPRVDRDPVEMEA